MLLLDFDYFDGKKYTEEQKNELELTWLRLYDEYYVMLDDSKSKFKMNKTFDELKLRDKINQIKNNYDFLVMICGYVGQMPNDMLDQYIQETYKRLIKIDKRIKPKFFDPVTDNLKMLDRFINSLINTYNQVHKDNVKSVESEINNVYDVVANAESWLERNLNINDMVVSHWIAIEKQVKQKQKAVKNKNNGK
ncbi:MAG: hypothetical protein HRU26_05650 [Psychroserpens sp.]|nr:hypothetical protein [Psychroserpens sp.]